MRALREWAVAWMAFTALALFFAISSSLTYWSTGRAANWSLTFARSLSEWWLWALVTPLVAWLARRFPIQAGTWRRAVGVHLAAGLVIAVAKTAADRAIFALISGFWMYWLASTLALQLFVYGAIVAAAHGIEYYRRSRERDQLEARLAETRLQVLNMQLQPHFLFNTLNAIAELVHENPESADQMITGLSDLLRRTLDLRDTQEIPLHGELELLAAYIGIQKTRFGNRLDVRMDVEDSARVAAVPMLLLQPLVENAIRHGLGTHLSAGRVDVVARRDGNILTIAVADDGGGAGNRSTTSDARVGIGLANTRARLEALYGASARLDLDTHSGHGARIIVRLPYRVAAGP